MKKLTAIISCVALFVAINVNAQSNFVGSGLALHFDGDADNYYDLGDNYNTLNFPLTLEAWVYQEGYELFAPLFATDGSTTGNYYGFYVRFNPTGKLIFEIGNGLGAGGEHRRGKMTTTSAPLNEWIHVAIVANSITDVKFYFNGVLQPATNTDGTATNTTILHNTNTVNLGRYATVHRADAFNGKIDEVRLWNDARSQTEIRDKMCEKLEGVDSSLIGYWIVDEDLGSTTLLDYSISGVNGTLVGAASKLISGAPIGNESIYSYLPDFTGFSMTLNSPVGDKLKVTKIGNSPYGIHVYRVDDEPFSTIGLAAYPGHYFGVFSADNAVDAKYSITYLYSYGNGVVTPINESTSTVFRRDDGSIDTWTLSPASLSISGKRLTKKNIIGRAEYIFNITDPNGTRVPQVTERSLAIYPVPAANQITVENIILGSTIEIVDISGKIIYSLNNASDSAIVIPTEGFPSGQYVVVMRTASNMETVNIIVQH